MRIYPYENESIFAEVNIELGLLDRAKVVVIFKEFDWDTDRITNEKRKNAKLQQNDMVCRKLAYYNVTNISNNGLMIDISLYEPVDIIEKKKETSEDSIDYRDYFRFK